MVTNFIKFVLLFFQIERYHKKIYNFDGYRLKHRVSSRIAW